ncbi:MAG: protein kinase [Sandaracinaceae bacterium]|nr:protein kinase [Sandaracinaceae bacterium]
MPELNTRVERLVAEGRHAEAADLLLDKGHVERAAELYAAVWQWGRAIEIAEEAGLFDIAYRHAIAGQDRDACGRVLAKLEARPEQAVRAATHAEQRGLLLDAARLREAAGETEAAAELYERAGDLRDAARCRIVLGELRKAGMLFERRLREDAEDGASALELGRILAQFGRWDHAVRALQKAAEHEAHEAAALRLLVACFAAMGMDEAAGSRLDALRRLQPELPVTVPEMLTEVYGDPRGVAALVGQADSERLLAGRYRVMAQLGAGATGRVLLAHDPFHDRQVAVKVLNVGGGASGRDAFVRFGREARVAAGIEHANVVSVFEFNPDGPFLVMEYMAGGTLADRLGDGPDERPRRLGPLRTWAMAKGVLSALEAVHRRGVVHRDLKPANVFYAENGDVKLGDFGVAHLTDLGNTLTGALVGTLAYMTPEQITGSSRPDASTDLYALGVILFRCLTGRLPFEGPDFVAQHLEDTPPAPSEVAPWLGIAFDDVFAKLLAKRPADRFASANDLVDALRTLPWAAAEEAMPPDEGEAAPARPASIAPAAAPSQSGARFEVLETREDGIAIARDELLERTVELVPLDAARAERLRAFARADGPYLQAVYEIDEALGRAVLEHPSGVPLATLGGRDPRRAVIVAQVREAIGRLHAERVVHGAVRAGVVVVGPARAVLRVALAPSPGADTAADWAGLDALGGRARGAP